MDDRRRDGGTNSTLRIKEQGTRLTLNEHDDDDDDDDDDLCHLLVLSSPTLMMHGHTNLKILLQIDCLQLRLGA